jgi:nitrite reductase/ring-hydroxylating ferredoxin subunit
VSAPPTVSAEIDVARVLCRVADVDRHGACAFRLGGGEWPLRGFVVRAGCELRAYVNRCPHAGHPLDLIPGRFLSPDGALILCASHGALFEKATGLCLAGPCPGQTLTALALEVVAGVVMLAAGAAAEMPLAAR